MYEFLIVLVFVLSCVIIFYVIKTVHSKAYVCEMSSVPVTFPFTGAHVSTPNTIVNPVGFR